jgi:hypothetical protein
MIRKLLGAPLKIVKRVLGREAPPPPPPPVRRAPPPRPAAPREDRGHDHGHSHDHGGGHDHGHSHGGAEREPEPPPAAVHDHGHGHDHGAPAEAVGAHIQIDESETPNPNARKFTCSVTVVEKGSVSFNTGEEAATHPLGRHIWPLGGVKGIFAVKDFVTVTKTDAASWSDLSRRVPDAIRRGLVERDGPR